MSKPGNKDTEQYVTLMSTLFLMQTMNNVVAQSDDDKSKSEIDDATQKESLAMEVTDSKPKSKVAYTLKPANDKQRLYSQRTKLQNKGNHSGQVGNRFQKR